MRYLAHTLATLYAVAALGSVRCAVISYDHHATGYVIFFAVIASLFATAIAHHAYHRDELRAARLQLEQYARPARPRAAPAATRAVIAIGGWCCDAWAATAGAEHDPATCTGQALRQARQERLLVLLARVQHGLALTEDEARALRQYVDTGTREAEQARAAVDRVRRLHSRGSRTGACNDCGQLWPCEVTRLLDQDKESPAP